MRALHFILFWLLTSSVAHASIPPRHLDHRPDDYLEETSSTTAALLYAPTPFPGMGFTFQYRSPHAPGDLDGDSDTAEASGDDYAPKYYAQVLLAADTSGGAPYPYAALRIGQARVEVWIANLRYRDSVEDRVHQVLADRLEAIHGFFGQIPDTLEDVWVRVALHEEAEARQLIDRTTATRHPFDVKYSRVEDEDWETCEAVLSSIAKRELLSRGW